jgi:hypothetical protein
MTAEWIESGLLAADVPASGERRERTVALARAIAPEARLTWRARVARPRVVVPLAVFMIVAMTSPGQAATDSVASFVAKVVPLRSQAAIIATPARGGSLGIRLRPGRGHHGASPAGPPGCVRPSTRGEVRPASRSAARAATQASIDRLQSSLNGIPARRRLELRVGTSGRIQAVNPRQRASPVPSN